jgi:hypothetical protein
MRVFNAINTNTRSIVFIYEGVQFWRENDEFVMQYQGKRFQTGDLIDYDEFTTALLNMKS